MVVAVIVTTDATELLRRWIRARGSICNGDGRPEHVVCTAEWHAYRVGNQGMFIALRPAGGPRRGVQPRRPTERTHP